MASHSLRRPSDREIHQKLAAAKAALQQGDYQFPLQKHLVADLDALGAASEDDLIELVCEFISEITVAGPNECYCGGRPPQRSYEREIKDLELWAYVCYSERFQREMYLKFALKKGVYLYVDFHESTP